MPRLLEWELRGKYASTALSRPFVFFHPCLVRLTPPDRCSCQCKFSTSSRCDHCKQHGYACHSQSRARADKSSCLVPPLTDHTHFGIPAVFPPPPVRVYRPPPPVYEPPSPESNLSLTQTSRDLPPPYELTADICDTSSTADTTPFAPYDPFVVHSRPQYFLPSSVVAHTPLPIYAPRPRVPALSSFVRRLITSSLSVSY